MNEIIRKFTCGHPEHMKGPIIWLFIENFFMSFPAVAIYFVIYMIAAGLENPDKLSISGLWIIAAVMGVLAIVQLLLSTGAFLGTSASFPH